MKKEIKTLSSSSSFSETVHYALYSATNYKLTIDKPYNEVIDKFVNILISYIDIFTERINTRNKLHYRFVFERGIDTLIRVFTILLYYTKNVELTYYHTQKAYYFYIEFVEQIMDDTVSFLHLSSRDAITFVYKKTIYELNNEFKKHMIEPNENDRKILSLVNDYINLYKTITFSLFDNENDLFYETISELNEDNKNEPSKINKTKINKINNINKIINKSHFDKNDLDLIYLFINALEKHELTKNQEKNYFFKMLSGFMQKMTTNKKNIETIKNNIYELDLDENYSEPNNIINLLFLS